MKKFNSRIFQPTQKRIAQIIVQVGKKTCKLIILVKGKRFSCNEADNEIKRRKKVDYCNKTH